MTHFHDPSDLPTLDLLGRRLEAASAAARAPTRRSRRTLALAASALMLFVATPAVASITGVFNDGDETIEEALTKVIDRSDPVATGRALERRGYTVSWTLIEDNPDRGRSGESPTIWRNVDAPPPGTEILSLLDGESTDTATSSSRKLLIEVAPSGSEIMRSHDQ